MSIASCGLGKENGDNPISIAVAQRLSTLNASGLKPLAVTAETARRLIGVGNTTLWKLIKEKKLRTARVGARTLIIYESIEELLGIAAATEDDEAS
jgi:excisionase family DNA binding protein